MSKQPFNPTPEQAAALPIIKWLFDMNKQPVRVGRTTIMAYYFIETAIEKPGEWITIFDHFLPCLSMSIDEIRRAVFRLYELHWKPNLNELKNGDVYYDLKYSYNNTAILMEMREYVKLGENE